MKVILVRWTVGLITATVLFGIVSPLFVRSFLPNEVNRGINTLPSGYAYRWRSEGYATTRIGPHGMPGKTEVPDGAKSRIALWGDSQAEGVTVADDEKLFAAIQAASQNTLDVYPLAISGDSLGRWLLQMPWAESELAVNEHWFLIVDLEDLIDRSLPDATKSGRLYGITSYLPAFTVVAAKNLLTDVEGNPRQLRFSLGRQSSTMPIDSIKQSAASPLEGWDEPRWTTLMRELRSRSELPIRILYCPPRPMIVGNHVDFEPPFIEAASIAARSAEAAGIEWIDLTEPLAISAQSGRWAHGFHNGQFGVGHLNATGNRVVAQAILAALDKSGS
jgi:lysophospholipase L1-like esterase